MGPMGSLSIDDQGDAALRLRFGHDLDPAVNARVVAAADGIRRARVPGVLSVIPGYTTVLVEFDPWSVDRTRLVDRLKELRPQEEANTPRLLRIPVLYGGEWGPDLDDVARRTGLSREAVVRLHSSVRYRVYSVGFSPGFPFAAPVPDPLVLPRRDSPRARVPAGSVAVAGRQTGIYPVETPGGWHLLGRTPLNLFQPEAEEPVAVRAGDEVQFVAVDRAAFDNFQGGGGRTRRTEGRGA